MAVERERDVFAGRYFAEYLLDWEQLAFVDLGDGMSRAEEEIRVTGDGKRQPSDFNR